MSADRYANGQGDELASRAIYGDKAAMLVTLVDDNGAVVNGGGQPIASNSSAGNLAPAGVFTGATMDLQGASEIRVSVFSSHASATDGLSVQQSSDGTNWDFVDAYSIPAATGKTFGFGVNARYGRVVYTNGATLTTSFRLQTLLKAYITKPSSVRPQDARTNDNDFEEVAAYGFLFNGTTWDRNRGIGGASFVQYSPLAGTDRSASVGTSSGVLMAANAARARLFIRNDAANAIWINLGATAVATPGGGNIKIAAAGGEFRMDHYSGVVNAIAETSAVLITAREF